MKCKWHLCTKPVEGKRRRNFCSDACKGKFFATKYRRALKVKAVKYKGGACARCGYNKSVRALDFHHLDGKLKIFNISQCNTATWKTVQAELDKCILLCGNCHREIEYEAKYG